MHCHYTDAHIPVTVPDGKSGDWEISTFTISEEGAQEFNMGQAFNESHRYVRRGTYKRLMYADEVVMSNVPAEIADHMEFIEAAKMYGGDILINGLGLGMALSAILEFNNVKSITVIEKSEDVLALVAPSYTDSRVTIIHADALLWKAPKGKKYDVVWHDIWNEIDTENSKTMGTLHRKYGRRCHWQSSWGRWQIRKMQREDREYRSSFLGALGGYI